MEVGINSAENTVKCRRIPIHGYVSKDILCPGVSFTKRPKEGSRCLVSMSMCRISGSFDCGYSKYINSDQVTNDLVIHIGEGDCELDRGIEAAICEMCIEEQAKVLLNQDNNSSRQLTLLIKLIQFSNTPYHFELTNEMKFQLALHHNRQGKVLFAENRIVDAFHRFSKALKLIIIVNQMESQNEFLQKKDLYVLFCNNLALCQMHFRNYDHVINLCNKVLNICPDNIKCLMRRTDAYLVFRDFEKANIDAKHILKIDPNNAYIRKRSNFITKNLEDQKKRCNKMMKDMFKAIVSIGDS